MRILFIISGLRYGGMERQLVEMIKSLTYKGYRLSLVVLNQAGLFSGQVEPFLEKRIYYLDRGKLKVPVTILDLARICRLERIEIMHVQDSFSAFYALPVSKFLKIPLINGAIRHAGVSHRTSYLYELLMIRLSDLVIANSQAGLVYFGINRGHVIYNFVDKSRFNPSHASLTSIVMNANFSDYKDHMTFFLACKKLISEGRLDRVGLIGDGRHRKTYEKISRIWGLSDKVTFHGHIHDVEEAITHYGIGVLCSTKRYREGISNAILEYMGAGLIAIGSDVGATSEVIQDGVNGYLFEAENPNSLYSRIRFVFDHSHEMAIIRKNAYQTLNEKFCADTNCDKLLEIYRSIV